jgi:transglutaminase-like putative cysteine protease
MTDTDACSIGMVRVAGQAGSKHRWLEVYLGECKGWLALRGVKEFTLTEAPGQSIIVATLREWSGQ